MDEVRKAFEFTLDKIGADIGAGPLWQEYIAFLQVGSIVQRKQTVQKSDLLRDISSSVSAFAPQIVPSAICSSRFALICFLWGLLQVIAPACNFSCPHDC